MLSRQTTVLRQGVLVAAVLLPGCELLETLLDGRIDNDTGGGGGTDTNTQETCVFRESELPPPTGPYCIGATDFHFVDPARDEPSTPDDPNDPREVMVRVFYPAEVNGGGSYGVYMEGGTLTSAAAEANKPHIEALLSATSVQYKVDAPMANGEFPLLLFSPGLGMSYQESTSILEEMTSHGYIVAAINHPYLSRMTAFPDGREVPLVELLDDVDMWEFLDERLPLLIGDLQLVLDNLITLNDEPLFAGRIDTDRIGALGHSFGGAASLAFINADSRVTAGINMDGSMPFSAMGTDPVDTPFLIHLAGTHSMAIDSSIVEFWQRGVEEKWSIHVKTAGHISYSDWPALIASFYNGEGIGEDLQGTIDPFHMLQLVRDSDRDFFDAYLKDKIVDPAIFEAAYPEAELIDADDPLPLSTRKSRYLEMSDGTRIAVDIWLPAGVGVSASVPTMVRATRYWRDIEVKQRDQLPITESEMEAQTWNEAGMAVVFVDVRGTGASFGSWDAPWSEAEVADFDEIVDWIVAQEWSDGQVAVQGISYQGNTADFFGLIENPAVKAVAPLFTDWNVYTDIAYPGGILNSGFLGEWNYFNQSLDANDICAVRRVEDPVACEMTKAVVGGVRPVDGDENHALLDAAVAEHSGNINVLETGMTAPFIDDPLGDADYLSISPAAYTDILDEDAPTYVVQASWTDASTAHGALTRYVATKNDTVVYIGPWSHGGGYDADPYLDPETPVSPSIEEQVGELIDLFAESFMGTSPTPNREIIYYTLGEGEWRATDVWPPRGTIKRKFFMRRSGALTRCPPRWFERPLKYDVDFTATTGPQNRWWTQRGGGDVVYPDRRDEDEKLLTYTSRPLPADLRLAGYPEIKIHLASTHEDGAVYVYLEDVAPDGTVTYITEGQLRLIHRAVSDNPPSWHRYGPYHSYTEADAAPMIPGRIERIEMMLQPTAVLIKKGHAIRVAIAGHDDSNFERLPETGDPTLTIFHNRIHASHLILPAVSSRR